MSTNYSRFEFPIWAIFEQIIFSQHLFCLCCMYFQNLCIILSIESTYIFTARKRSLRQGNMLTPVCHSVHKGGCLVPSGCLEETPSPDGYCCGRYAAYWNAFLFLHCEFIEIKNFHLNLRMSAAKWGLRSKKASLKKGSTAVVFARVGNVWQPISGFVITVITAKQSNNRSTCIITVESPLCGHLPYLDLTSFNHLINICDNSTIVISRRSMAAFISIARLYTWPKKVWWPYKMGSIYHITNNKSVTFVFTVAFKTH